MQLIADHNNALSADSVDEEMPTRWLDGAIVINRDLSMAIGWRIQPPHLPTLSDAERDDLHAKWRALIHNLGPDTDIQVIYDSWSPTHDEWLKVFDRSANHPFLDKILAEKGRLFREGFASTRLRLSEAYVFISRKAKLDEKAVDQAAEEHLRRQAEQMGKRFGPLQKLLYSVVLSHFNPAPTTQCTTAEYQRARAAAIEEGDAVHLKLERMGLRPAVLSEQGIVDLFFRFWHPKSYAAGQRPRRWSKSDLLPLTRYFLRSGADRGEASGDEADTGFLVIDGVYHRLVTVRNPPVELEFSNWADMLMFRGLHKARVITTVKRETLEARKKFLKDKMDLAKMKQQQDETYRQAALDIESALEQLGSGLESCWWGRSVLHVWGDTREEVTMQINRALGAAETAEGFELVPEDVATWDYWRASQPGWTREQDRHRDIPFNAAEVATMLPVVGQPTVLGTPIKGPYQVGALYETLNGSVYNVILHSDDFANYSALVVGGSGSGKTFTVNDLAAQFAASHPAARVIVIDFKKPGSFRSMAMARSGNYLDFDLESETNRINPLEIPKGGRLTRDQLDSIVHNIAKRISDPARNGGLVTEEEMSAIERVVSDLIVRSDGRELLLRDVHKALSQHNRDIAVRLAPWVGEGRYAKLADGRTNISVDNPFTVFDFERIAGNKHLCQIMFSTVVQHAMNAALADPSAPKLLIYDEAWEQFEDPAMAKFIERAVRVLRAANFSVMGVSQGVEDFTKIQNKSAIINNLSHYIILRQNTPAAAEALAVELGLNPYEVARAKALQMVPGQYSQALIVQKRADGSRTSVVINNRASPLQYWACTTRGHERQLVAEQLATGKSYFDAIEELARRYPQGASG